MSAFEILKMANSRDSLPSVRRFLKPLCQNGTFSLFDVVSCDFVFPFLLFFGFSSYFVPVSS